MKQELLKLLKLQDIDLEINKRERALAGLDNGDTTRAEIAGLKAAADEATACKRRTEKEFIDRDLEFKGIEQKKKKAEELMYSGKVRNLKELEDLQKETAMFNKEIDRLSTRVLELMDEQETCRHNEKESLEALHQEESKLAAIVDEFESTSSRLKQEIENLRQEREGFLPQIAQPVLQKYQQVQARLGVLAAVAIKDTVCTGCHVAIPSHLLKDVRDSKRLQVCDSCSRILVWAIEDIASDEEETEQLEERE